MREPSIAAANRPLIGKPSVASLIAGWNRSFHGSLPCALWARSSMRIAPGVPIERPLARALGFGIVWSVASSIQRR